MTTGEQPLMGNVPTVEVACANSGCPRHGIGQWVRLQLAAQQFAVMPVLICTRCGQAAMVVRPWQPRLHVVASNTDPVSDSHSLPHAAAGEGVPRSEVPDGGARMPVLHGRVLGRCAPLPPVRRETQCRAGQQERPDVPEGGAGDGRGRGGGDRMSPKITVHGGVTNAFEQGPPGFTAAWSDEDTPNEWPAQQADAEATEGGEQPSPGNSSSPSAARSAKSGDSSKPSGQKRARNAGSPSKKRGASSTADSTAGPQTSTD